MKQHDFPSLQQRYWVVSPLWTRFSDSDCERSCPRNDNKFPKNSSGSLSLLLSQRQQFLNNHLPLVPGTPNQQGTHEKRDKVLSSVAAQEGLDTRRYQVSADLDDVEFYWERIHLLQLDVDAVFRSGIDTPFPPTAFDNLETGVPAENPILLDEEEDKENSPPPTRTTVSEKPTWPPALPRSRPFGTRIENVPDCVFRSLFQ